MVRMPDMKIVSMKSIVSTRVSLRAFRFALSLRVYDVPWRFSCCERLGVLVSCLLNLARTYLLFVKPIARVFTPEEDSSRFLVIMYRKMQTSHPSRANFVLGRVRTSTRMYRAGFYADDACDAL